MAVNFGRKLLSRCAGVCKGVVPNCLRIKSADPECGAVIEVAEVVVVSLKEEVQQSVQKISRGLKQEVI